MKLNLLFIVIDLFIVMVYPLTYVHGRLHPFSKPKEDSMLENSLRNGSIIAGRE